MGDAVAAADPATGREEARPVTATIVHSGPHRMADVALGDGTTVSATGGHPFWDATLGRFAYAADLRPGDALLRADGSAVRVASVRLYSADLAVYNLSVDGLHTYYAGADPVLVHNCTLRTKPISWE